MTVVYARHCGLLVGISRDGGATWLTPDGRRHSANAERRMRAQFKEFK